MSILIWVVPYFQSLKPFMTSLALFKGITLYVLIAFALSTLLLYFIGHSFYLSAYKSLKHGSANMDVLIVLGTTAAWSNGVIRIICGYSTEE